MTLPRADSTAAARGIAKQIGRSLATAIIILALAAAVGWLFF